MRTRAGSSGGESGSSAGASDTNASVSSAAASDSTSSLFNNSGMLHLQCFDNDFTNCLGREGLADKSVHVLEPREFLGAGRSREHDNRNVLQRCIRANSPDHLEAVHLRHV